MQIWKWEKELAGRLSRVDSPELCARLLLRHITGYDELEYLLALREELPEDSVDRLEPLARRRMQGEPMAYILGRKEFYGNDFRVDSSVLVPRPETEMLVDLALAKIDTNAVNFVDAGCGSGCIGLSLGNARPSWRGFLLDNSMEALKIAAENADEFSANAALLLADMRKMPFADCALDLVISNPPYIDGERRNGVMPEVLAYEPHSALFSEMGGLGHIRSLVLEASRILLKGGWVLFEHGFNQGADCRELLHAAGFCAVDTVADFAGLPRCALGKKR